MSFTGSRQLAAQNVRETSTTQQEDLGAIGVTSDGREYQYAKVGSGGALAAGSLGVAEAVAANHTNIVVSAAAAIGATQVSATLGATAATENQYAEGYLVVNDSTGEGIAYKIANHAAVASAGVITVNLEEPVVVALVASTSEVSLIKHISKDIQPSTTLATAVGVANVATAASSYGWVQRKGTCSVTADGTPAKSNALIQSNATAGALEVGAAATDQVVGYAQETFVTTENRAAKLVIS